MVFNAFCSPGGHCEATLHKEAAADISHTVEALRLRLGAVRHRCRFGLTVV